MDVILTPQTFPVAILDGFVQEREINIVMQCHDRIFNDVHVRDESNEILFTVESKGAGSASWRRIVKDATGTPIFHFRKLFRKWVVENPAGQELCSMKHASFRYAQALDVVVHNQGDKGSKELVEVRPKDEGCLMMIANIQDAPVAQIQITEVNGSRTRDRSIWKARIASGVDLTLMIAIMLCRAEILHVWNK